MIRRLLVLVPVAAAGVLVAAPPAHADHTHFRVLGSGACVLLAPNGGEKDVELPHADTFAENRRHPLHVNVHLGRPGEVGQVFVAYTANGVPTADALRLCGNQYVNR